MSQNSHLSSLLIEPHYFGSIHYFARLLYHKTITIEVHENYQKGSYRNRSYISGPNGPILLSIPLQKGKNEQQPLKDVRISYAENWRRQHLQAIISSYNRTPFYEYISNDVHALFEKKPDFLIDFTLSSCLLFVSYLKKINLDAQTDQYLAHSEAHLDFRNQIQPKAHKEIEDERFIHPEYYQVFQEKTGFINNLSIMDLFVMEGENTESVLRNSILA